MKSSVEKIYIKILSISIILNKSSRRFVFYLQLFNVRREKYNYLLLITKVATWNNLVIHLKHFSGIRCYYAGTYLLIASLFIHVSKKTVSCLELTGLNVHGKEGITAAKLFGQRTWRLGKISNTKCTFFLFLIGKTNKEIYYLINAHFKCFQESWRPFKLATSIFIPVRD